MYRRFRTPTVWQEMDRLQREMDRVFRASSPSRMGTGGYPAMNIWSNEDSAVITTELPGIDLDDIDISVVGDTMTLTGKRTAEELPEGARYHRQERGFGKFTRSIKLPYTVDGDKVEATYNRGVLSIELPRAESDKPRKIQVRSA
jgi:HSP20 family protein